MTEGNLVQDPRSDPLTDAVSNAPWSDPAPDLPGEHLGSHQPRRPIRRIGPIGTFIRIVLGLGLVYLAAFDEWTMWDWGLAWHEAILGIVVFPALVVLVVLLARRFSDEPIRLMGPLGLALNTAAIILLLEGRYTHDAALLFYGLSFPIAAWRDLPGCEVTVVSNLILGRDDQIGCPVMAPVDEVERNVRWWGTQGSALAERMKRARPRTLAGPAQTSSEDPSQGVGNLETEGWRSMLHIGVCLGVGIVTVLVRELI